MILSENEFSLKVSKLSGLSASACVFARTSLSHRKWLQITRVSRVHLNFNQISNVAVKLRTLFGSTEEWRDVTS